MVFTSTKKLGFGLMRLPLLDPQDPGSIDIETTKKMVDIFIERGFTYFDTAWMYCDFKSENAAKEVLVDRYPRDKFTLATKLHYAYFKTAEDMENIFNSQLEKTGAGYFDYYLLHAVNATAYEKYKSLDCFTWLEGKRAKGLVKNIGFSFHDSPDVLDRVLTENEGRVDFVQIQLNYLDWSSDSIRSGECYAVAEKHGVPLVIMEPVKGGTLINALPKAAKEAFKEANPDASYPSWAIRFAASLPNVKMVLSGMSSVEQVLDNTSYMADFKPLSDEERKVIERVVEIIRSGNAIECTACSYCTSGCPMSICIPRYFALYNQEMQEDQNKDFTIQGSYYRNLNKQYGKASDCVECGQCESICPQHLPIRNLLKIVADTFE